MSQPDQNLDQPLSWLDAMEDIVTWQVISPRLQIPFGPRLSTGMIRRFVDDRQFLMRNISLRGLIDGYEFVLIKNVPAFLFDSDHCIFSNAHRHVFSRYFQKEEMHKWLELQLDELQDFYREELEKRREQQQQAEAQRAEQREESFHQKQLRKQREEEEARKGDRTNRFYSGGSANKDKD